jgi:lysozyme family protein
MAGMEVIMPFEDGYKQTAQFEGGYANVPGDKGGETFRGISRRSHPNWPGWKLIDFVKETEGHAARTIDRHFDNDQEMKKLVEEFYKTNYWDPLSKGDAK